MSNVKNVFANFANSFESTINNLGKSKDTSESRDKNQIAGHDADEFGRKRLFFEGDKVFKLYDPDDPRGKREFEFYEDVKKNCPEILGRVIPNYWNSVQRQQENATKPGDYLVMENIFKVLDGETCLADIKIGKPITIFDREKNAFKNQIVNDLAKYGYARCATPGLLREGFQVLGIKVKNIQTGTWEKFGKSLGRSDHILGVEFIIDKFLGGADYRGSHYRRKVIECLIRDLETIKFWLSQQKTYKFRGSSLVLAYLPPDNINIQKILSQNDRKESIKSVEYATPGIPIAGTTMMPTAGSNQMIIDPIAQQIPAAGLDSYDKPLAVVRLIDFNNFEDHTNEIDKESLSGVSNLIRQLYEQLG